MNDKESTRYGSDGYWRESLRKFRKHQAESLGEEGIDTGWIDELTGTRAREILETLESVRVMLLNRLPFDYLGDED